MARKKKRDNRVTRFLLIIVVLMLIISVINRRSCRNVLPDYNITYTDGLDRALANYSDEVLKYADEFNLPANYLLALIVLESSGRRVIPPRFEPHVYQRLKEVKNGRRESYEHVTSQHLHDATDDALKNLASSWGPFQVMGYKCLLMGIKVKDIRGKDAIYWGIKWIDMNYGNELRAGKFKDAFHIHNTGRKFPSSGRPFTYDPQYVAKGLKYMDYFEKHL